MEHHPRLGRTHKEVFMKNKILIIQENGRHAKNRRYRECFSLQRAFLSLYQHVDVWGLGHSNYLQEPDWESYDLIINLENYDESGWVPSLAKVQATKLLWSIDAHVKGLDSYLNTAHEGNYDLILQATPEFVTNNSIWFPNCYDDFLIRPLGLPKKHDVGFCGNIVNRASLISVMSNNFNFKLDEFVIGNEMVEAINTYKVHWNANIGIDINYRNFETMGCGTCLLTSHNPHLSELGMEDGENCLVYNNVEEMVNKARIILEDDQLRTRIGKAGNRLAKLHTYTERAKKILNHLNKE